MVISDLRIQMKYCQSRLDSRWETNMLDNMAQSPKPKKETKRARAPSKHAIEPGEGSLGRTPPHNSDAEQGLLACCMRENGHEVLTDCIDQKLVEEAFFRPAHQVMFAGMIELYNSNTPIHEVILAEQLNRMGLLEEAGGLSYINEVSERIETTAYARHWLDIVKEKYMLRRLIRVSVETVEGCFEHSGELESFLGMVEEEVFKISQDQISDSAQPISSAMEEVIKTVNLLLRRESTSYGLRTGFKDLDRLTFGFQPQQMIVLAARPSVGKTSFGMNIAETAVLPHGDEEPKTTLVFSLEMSTEQLAMRMLCGRARVNMNNLRDGFSSSEDQRSLVQSAKEISKAPLLIDDSGHLNILELRAKARRVASRHKLGLIVVDYLQLISGTDNRVPREQQIAEISRGIKAMAKELNIPILVLSQLNRESERDKREPRMSDLRESGSIEQDADVVMLLHRPKKEGDEEGFSPEDVEKIRLILAKQRNGPTGAIDLAFIRRYTRFENYSAEEVPI